MLWKTCSLFAATLLLCGGSYYAIAGEGDQKMLQGDWTAAKGDEKIKLTFDGKKFKFQMIHGAEAETVTGTFTIDSSKKPKTMDMMCNDGSGDHAMKFKGKTAKAIFEFDGAKLKWCSHEPGVADRPDAFPADGAKSKAMC